MQPASTPQRHLHSCGTTAAVRLGRLVSWHCNCCLRVALVSYNDIVSHSNQQRHGLCADMAGGARDAGSVILVKRLS